jgi:hypothetical protein
LSQAIHSFNHSFIYSQWYQYVEVGHALKTPDLPIWVVCSESHFTVLFSLDARPLRDRLPFELHYYDELANQQAPVRLTVSWVASCNPLLQTRPLVLCWQMISLY